MLIANPIYDCVFKYLLEDNKVARLIISTLLDAEVVELEYKPTEVVVPDEVKSPLHHSVLRIDFSVQIKKENGELQTVLVELQKIKLPHDIIRFRRYLAAAYRSISNIKPGITPKGNPCSIAIPIIPVYILGHELEHITVPTVRIRRHYEDVVTGDIIHERDEFAEGISHDALIIQLPRLKQRRRNAIEQMMAFFDPTAGIPGNPHFLEIKEKDVPERYREIHRRLLKAAAEPQIQSYMDEEDDYLRTLSEYEQTLFLKDQVISEERRAKEEALQAKEEERRAKEEERQAKEEERQAKEEALRAKEALEKELAELRKKIGK
jgi:hypothetical protein